MLKQFWKYWANALGAKAGNTNREADIVAVIRTLILFLYMFTNMVIVLGVWRQW